MTLQEFSLEFDLLYDNISSNQAPGLTEYEKSVFLTQAQDALVLDLYKGTSGDSFETTEEVTRYLNTLVKSKTYNNLTSSSFDENNRLKQTSITLDKDVMFVTYQVAKSGCDWCLVVPTTQDNLYKTLQNPFTGPNSKRIISSSEDNKILLYSIKNISDFKIKYLQSPEPIILSALDSDLTIKGKNTALDCALPECTHQMILMRAVQMAKAVWA